MHLCESVIIQFNLLIIPCTSLLFSSSRLLAISPLDSSSFAWTPASPPLPPIILTLFNYHLYINLIILTCCLARTMASSGNARLLGAFNAINRTKHNVMVLLCAPIWMLCAVLIWLCKATRSDLPVLPKSPHAVLWTPAQSRSRQRGLGRIRAPEHVRLPYHHLEKSPCPGEIQTCCWLIKLDWVVLVARNWDTVVLEELGRRRPDV